MQVDMCKKLEETMHVLVRLLSQDSTFDLTSFQIFSKIWVAKLRVRLICECGLYAGVYGSCSSLDPQKKWPLQRSLLIWNADDVAFRRIKLHLPLILPDFLVYWGRLGDGRKLSLQPPLRTKGCHKQTAWLQRLDCLAGHWCKLGTTAGLVLNFVVHPRSLGKR